MMMQTQQKKQKKLNSMKNTKKGLLKIQINQRIVIVNGGTELGVRK